MAPDTRRGTPAADAPTPDAAVQAASVGLGRLDRQIDAIRARQGDTVALADVTGVVESLLDSLNGDVRAEDLRLYREVETLAHYIHAAKAEIAALNPVDIREEFLPTAADELDAIVQATEKATGDIMDATEIVDGVAADLAAAPGGAADASQALSDATTRIYEACSFQDITGQRITKVVRMLKSIEVRVDALVSAFDPQGPTAAGAERGTGRDDLQAAGNFGRDRTAATGDRQDDAALLNGPQSEDGAMKQGDIDALLASFD